MNKDAGGCVFYLQESNVDFTEKNDAPVDICCHFPSLSVSWNIKIPPWTYRKVIPGLVIILSKEGQVDMERKVFALVTTYPQVQCPALTSANCAKADARD